MATDVEICNLALDHIQAKAVIQSLDEDSKEANVCKRHYEVTRDEVLRAHDWGFASEFVRLTQLVNEGHTGGFLYTYAYPQNCLRVREILPETDVMAQLEKTQSYSYTAAYGYNNRRIVPYRLGRVSGAPVIYTSLDEAWARYTAPVVETQQFDALFTNAFSYALAAKILMPMRGNVRALAALTQERDRIMLEAQGADANEQTSDANFEASWVDAR